MANFYYLGRRAFNSIYLWMSLSVIFTVCGFMAFLSSYGKLQQSKKIQLGLVEQERSFRRQLEGTNFDPAIKAATHYKDNILALKVEDHLYKGVIDNGNYSEAQLRKLKRSIHQKATTKEDIEKMLMDFAVEGYLAMVSHQKDMIAFYTGVMTGFKDDTYKTILERYSKEIPLVIQQLLKREDGFNPSEGANPFIKSLEGEIKNLDVGLGDLKGKEIDSIAKSVNKREEQQKVYVTLKKDFFDKADTRKQNLWENMDQQNKNWSVFITKTQKAVGKSRTVELRLFNKKFELEQLEKVYADKIGPIWVPPLDLVDGEVLATKAESGIILINIGRSQGLVNGQAFNVYHMKGKILQEVKGRIQVTQLSDHMSICKIVNFDEFNPISEGDVIADGKDDNHFDRKVPPTYVLSGEFSNNPSIALIKTMIFNGGGVIKEELKKNIEYMIVGDKHIPADIEAAKKLGVRVIHSRDLAGHLGFNREELIEFSSQYVEFD